MKTKNIIILIVGLILTIVVLYLCIPTDMGKNETVEKQLYTCGMHPDIISEEPGNCPICEMKLTPIKNSNNSSVERKIMYWRAPMDPNEIYDEPGKSQMGMELVPVYEDEGGAEGIVTIDPAVVQNINVKTEKVIKRKLSNIVVTNGILTSNETLDYVVNTRVNGWVEKLYINYTGQMVRKGEKLMDIYSPELVAAQQELLTAISYQKAIGGTDIKEILKSGNELIKNSVRKLELLEMPDSDINKLQETGEVKTFVTLYAQNSGTVITKHVVDGQKIMPGMQLLHISDLSSLWLTADIYEYELSKIELGSKAEIRFNFMPGKVVKGKISFIYPTLDSKTRTAKIRIDIDNRNGQLKPAMLANVSIIGKDLGDYPVVPENSVLRSGKRDVVIIALGEGKFKPQQVELGEYSDGYYQIKRGLVDGASIVTSAQFLIDSESNLKAAISQFSSPGATTGDNEKSEVMAEPDMGKMETEAGPDKQADDLKMDHSSHDHAQMEMSSETIEESIVREGVIDLKAIDKNGDGMVFQDLMDWNVISDEPGRCPLCEMKLSEVSLETAKQNLIDHNFQVK